MAGALEAAQVPVDSPQEKTAFLKVVETPSPTNRAIEEMRRETSQFATAATTGLAGMVIAAPQTLGASKGPITNAEALRAIPSKWLDGCSFRRTRDDFIMGEVILSDQVRTAVTQWTKSHPSRETTGELNEDIVITCLYEIATGRLREHTLISFEATS